MSINEQLRNTFGLRRAVVVEDNELSESFPEGHPGRQFQNDTTDKLHAHLADRAAEDLRETYLQSGDHVAVGTGRGVALTAKYFGYRYLNAPLTQKLETLTISPLTGFLSATLWGVSASECDASTAALDLAKGCWSCKTNNLPLSVSLDADKRSRIPRLQRFLQHDSPLALEQWVKPTGPKIAIVGVGSLVGGHRMLHRPAPPEIAAVAELIDALIDYIAQDGNPLPIGDLCNHLFVVRPDLLGKPFNTFTLETAEAKIKVINDLLITAKKEHFQQECLEKVLLVAGGEEKAPTLWYVLTQLEFAHKVILYTDSACAKQLMLLPRP